MDIGTWHATVHWVTESDMTEHKHSHAHARTHTHTHTHALQKAFILAGTTCDLVGKSGTLMFNISNTVLLHIQTLLLKNAKTRWHFSLQFA